MDIDGAKDLVTVKGTMNVQDLTPYLKDKLKRNVEVVPPPKKEDDKKDKAAGAAKEGGGGGDKKEAEAKPAAAADGGEKKKDETSAEAPKVEASKMEYYGLPPPTIWYNGHVASEPSYAMEVHQGYVNHNQGYYGNPVYVNQGYPVDPPPYYMQPHQYHPQMFSDENPNACSVM